MNVTRTSILDGTTNTIDLNVTQSQIDAYELGGVFIQDAFPALPASEREFIKSGITAAQWEEEFGF
jgi:hypothetical protein